METSNHQRTRCHQFLRPSSARRRQDVALRQRPLWSRARDVPVDEGGGGVGGEGGGAVVGAGQLKF